MARSSDRGKGQAKPRSVFSWFVRLVFTLLVLLAILYATVLAASRTAGFHAIVERRLTETYPLVWNVEAARVTWRLALQLDAPRARTSADEIDEVFRADRVQIAPDWWALARLRLACGGVHILRPVALFHRTETGWSPAALADWAHRLDPSAGLIPAPGGPVASAAPAAAGARERPGWPPYVVEMTDGRMEWRAARLESAMTATGVHLKIRPVRSGHRVFMHGTLRAETWHGAMGTLHRGYSVEWLAMEHRRWILSMDENSG